MSEAPPEGLRKDVQKELEKILFQRGRRGKLYWLLFAIAVFFAFLEINYVLHFNLTLMRILRNIGIDATWLVEPSIFNQLYPAKGIILSIVVFSAIIMYPITRKKLEDRVPLYDWVLAILFAIGPLYVVYLYLVHHTVEAAIEKVTLLDIVFIALIIAGVLEATRRALGIALPILTLVFIIYGFYFAYTTAPYTATGLDWMRRLFNLFIAQNTGFLGIPLNVMVTYVFAFLFFSAVLRHLGIGEYITNLILSIVGKRPGGPAKVAVVSSALMGTISGSSVANVLTTGTFSIPAMKKAGFPPESAGAIEPVASTGGQLMPPIMGAAAFIMAEFIGRPYRDIMIAAALPSILYFYSIYVFVDKEAKRLGLRGAEKVPPLIPLLKKIYFMAPIPVIIYALLFIEPQHAVMAALSSAVIVAWLVDEKLPWLGKLLLTGILVVLGVLISTVAGMPIATALFTVGVASVIIGIAAGFVYRGARFVTDALVKAIDSSLRDSVPVFLAAASASVIQAMITFTNLHKTLGDVLLAASMNQIYLLLIMTAIFSLILGMGVPTTANYIITATILAPALVAFTQTQLGYPEPTAKLASHMFVFYYGILADITPPVALAAYVGAIIAGANFWKTAINAVKYGIAKYILPFIFVVSPVLLITAIPQWTLGNTLQLVKTIAYSIIIFHAVASGFTGWLYGPIREKWLRALLAVLGFASVSLNDIVVLVTLAVLLATAAKQALLAKREKPVVREVVGAREALADPEEKSGDGA